MNYALAAHQNACACETETAACVNPLLSATTDKAVQTTSNITTDNNFHTHYIIYFIFTQHKFLRLDTTFFLHKSKYKLLIEM